MINSASGESEFQFPPSVVGPEQCLNVLMDDVVGQTPEINQNLVTHLSPLLFKLLEQIFFISPVSLDDLVQTIQWVMLMAMAELYKMCKF